MIRYPKKDNYMKNTPTNLHAFYHKMIEEWSDLEYTVMQTMNKKIEAPQGGHDDVCCSDVLGVFASFHANSSGLGIRASSGRMFGRK